jgi:indole-3-glycerol phosphate synthase
VADYYRSGADVVLVGEALVRSGDPRDSVGTFIRAATSR